MKCNVGPLDKRIRLFASVALVIGGIVYRSMWGLLGVPLVVTAIMGYCPAYALCKISTIPGKKRDSDTAPKGT